MGSMRDSDRFWWQQLLLGLAFCVAAIAYPWYLLTQDLRNASFITPDAYTFNISFDVFSGLICLGLAAIFLAMAARARDRHQKRVAALRGDLSGMPLATIQPDPVQAPDVSAQPLEVLWRVAGPTAIYSRVILFPLGLIVFIGGIGAYIYFGIAPIFFPSMQSRPLSPSEMAVSAAISCGAIAGFVGLGWYAARMVPTLFGHPFGARATPEGVEGRTDSGARSFIAWDEVRLFEVIGPQGNALRSFALYAPGKAVIWRDYRTGIGSEYAPAGATASENAQRQAALLNLITARTGLEPRTLARALRRGLIGIPANSQRAGALTLAVFALCFWALAIGEYLSPITPYAWANLPSVAALSLLGLLFAVYAIIAAIRYKRAVSLVGPPNVAAPSLDSPASAYSLRWRDPISRRARIIVSGGLLLAVNLIPAAIIAPQAFSSDTSVSANPFTVLWNVSLGTALGLMGLAGLMTLFAPIAVFGWSSMNVSIRADAAGLSSDHGARTKQAPWSMMREIIWRPRGLGGYPFYAMLTDNPLEAITWPTSPHYLIAAAPPDGAMPIGPDELAALVAARIGRPIRVVA